MFELFYGLRTDPFRLTPDHQFSFDHEQFSKAKAYIDYALVRGEGFVMITGNPGTGKTTLVADLQARLPATETTTATINCTQLDAEALLLISAYEFGLAAESNNKALILRELMLFFRREHQSGRRVLLIIDEAQDLSIQALEELRLLTNLQDAGQPLLQIVLLGQSSLLDLVRRPELTQVHQRIVAATHLQALKPRETVAYVRYRMKTAGWTGDPVFHPGVLETVHAYSQGIPRLINQICSRLLLRGFSLELHELAKNDARQILRELQDEGLIPPRNPADLQNANVPAAQWSDIDQGLYPEKPAQIPDEPPIALPQPAQQTSHDQDLIEAVAAEATSPSTTNSAAAPVQPFDRQQLTEAPVPPRPTESSVNETENQPKSEPEPEPEPEHNTKSISPFLEPAPSHPISSHTKKRFAVAFVVITLFLYGLLAGLLLTNKEFRESLINSIIVLTHSVTRAIPPQSP